MATLNDRLATLERNEAAAVQARPVPFFILPAEGDPDRAAIQDAIAARACTKAGQDCIVYEVVR